MGQLDDAGRLASLDTENMLGSIDDFSDQLMSAAELFRHFVLPTHFIQAREVVILGAGASAAAGEMAASLARYTSTVPIILVQNDRLPNHVGSHTLVIAVSYSGTTQETVSAFAEAGRRSAKLLGISTGGEIGSICRKYRSPHFQIHYGAQPRAAFGYLFVPVIGTLHRLGLVEFESADALDEAIAHVRDYQARLTARVATQQNPAKQLAELLGKVTPIFVSSDRLAPIARRWKSQWNENAKRLAFAESFPAIAHSAAAGLDHPVALRDQLILVSIRSAVDSEQESLAQNLFHQLVTKLKYAFTEVVTPPTGSLLQDCLVLTVLGDYASTYVALLHGVDPTPTPHIMEMKERLNLGVGTYV